LRFSRRFDIGAEEKSGNIADLMLNSITYSNHREVKIAEIDKTQKYLPFRDEFGSLVVPGKSNIIV